MHIRYADHVRSRISVLVEVGVARSSKPAEDASDKKMVPAVEETLEHVVLQPEDAALARLALSYARTIDKAAAIAAQADRIPFDPDTAEEIKKLKAKVSAHATMADLGPKLQACLDALGATPKARAQNGKPAKGGSGPSKLSALRGGAA